MRCSDVWTLVMEMNGSPPVTSLVSKSLGFIIGQGAPYKAQQVIRRILNEQYSSRVNGLPGNDDLGSMGAWYVFASIGLFPEIPGVGGFSVNSPVFRKIVLHLPEGDVIIKGVMRKRVYPFLKSWWKEDGGHLDRLVGFISGGDLGI